MDLDKLNYAQRERLAFIDFCSQFTGQISRADLITHFGIGLASSSRDLTLYKELAPSNLELKHEDKQYYRTNEFQPVFTHNPEAVLTSLCRGFGDGLSNGSQPSNHCFDATRLIHPYSEVIATLMRAINSKKVVRCDYVSLSSGEGEREIVPHSIANNGLRWHVRAFDCKNNEFRDFVCTRLQNVSEIVQAVSDNQLAANDMSWNNILNVELSVHPSIKHKKAIELDYNMIDGVLRLEVREALLGYLMRQWNVDCTKNASLVGDEYHLWLSNINELENVASMTISPGYK
ncbi:WYL domain-containing protein [Pseudoalteromonas sp. Angola-4]|uniref:WYL domain-containing protein n=1 Tax=Pseudoalteromonas sp. Angola-4 TaxID=3025335 RepID=UPI002359C20B|nr:WYL domain-containing protein [Pseudoalteromonas sp. Angola-4]MDC9508995.1 WYL domain-containing protein [Pseudoalteromonas sp. Angola-4]